jgi:hypothetical protein
VSDLNMQLVRECFELNRFHVLTHWQHEDLVHSAEPGYLLFVERIVAETEREAEFVLRAEEIGRIRRAVVEVRAWHADRVYPSVIEGSPALAHVASEETRALGQSAFLTDDFTSILVISELPSSPRHRARSVQLLQELGIGHVIEFPTILQDLLAHTSANGNYAPSQTLQTLRLLKRYNFIRRQQLEFLFPLEAPVAPGKIAVAADAPVDEDEEED